MNKCTAALLKPENNPHCSVVLCNAGSQQAVFHCSYTEICSSYRLTAGSFSLQLHLCRFALHTGSHQAVFHCSDTKEICSAYRPTAGTISLPLHL
ncbi:TPA: hypothetical protein ACH3X1_013453 [Trebouxia sp. C0004]